LFRCHRIGCVSKLKHECGSVDSEYKNPHNARPKERVLQQKHAGIDKAGIISIYLRAAPSLIKDFSSADDFRAFLLNYDIRKALPLIGKAAIDRKYVSVLLLRNKVLSR